MLVLTLLLTSKAEIIETTHNDSVLASFTTMLSFNYDEKKFLNQNIAQFSAMVNSTALKILLVDDSSAVRESLKTVLLLEDNLEVVGEADSGREAVEIARALKPDVVVMDLEMPDGSGFDGINACAEIKRQNLARAVIILTIHADRTSRQRAKDANCDFFIEKGTSSAELLKLLSQFQA